jgi:hypothetical protein
MTLEPGFLILALILLVLLSCVAAWIIASRYRRRMRQLICARRAEDSTASATGAAAPSLPSPATVSLADNRSAGMRLTMIWVALSCLLAATSACLWWALSFPGEPLPQKRVAVMALLQLWPVIPVVALMWRWSRPRLVATLLLWCGATFIVFLWRQIELRPFLALAAMANEIGLPLVLVSLVFVGSATRAVAPWLLLPAAVLMWSSLLGLDVLMSMGRLQSPTLVSLVGWFESFLGWHTVYAVPALFALLPWALAWWPAWVLARTLSRAYVRKWVSDLLVVFIGVWALTLTDKAVTVAPQAGIAAVAMYVPLLWILPAVWLARRQRPDPERAPTLLVLRVFQQDAQTRDLFDHLVERWRLSGNTVLIAGTDLADRTLDADNIFRFLEGRLAEHFIVSPADVARRIAPFDMTADIDGRYRVNQCYCHDTTWQNALQALVSHSDVVVMDLRGFRAHNAGCRYELATLAHASRQLRILVLVDSFTDREAAREAMAASQERFTFVEASHFNASEGRKVLARLFA